jgi:hypothetical protein
VSGGHPFSATTSNAYKMPINATQGSSHQATVRGHQTASVMKKPTSARMGSAAPAKATATRLPALQSSTAAPAPSAAETTRLDVSPPSGLAVKESDHIHAKPSLRKVRFGYFHPEAKDVFLVGSFNGWDPRATPLNRDPLGDWSVEIELPNGEHHYRFVVDGEWRDDPTAQLTEKNPFGGFDAVMVVV